MSTSTSSQDAPNLPSILKSLQYLALRASSQILASTTPTLSLKKNSTDLVTETDKSVEALLHSTLSSLYPTYSFMGEETYKDGDTLTNAPTFIVDPIDGTTNFVHGYPGVAVSLGFTISKEPVVGVVLDVYRGVMYSAAKGHGAELRYYTPPHLKGFLSSHTSSSSVSGGEDTADEKPLSTHTLPLKGNTTHPRSRPLEPLTSLSKSLIALEWGNDRSGADYATKCKIYNKLCRSKAEGGAMVHSVRSLGSAALNFCAVAEGSVDLYWESGCWAWDVAAAWIILKEAGGVVVDPLSEKEGGKGWKPTVDGRRYLAVRKGWSEEIVGEFWDVVEGEIGGMSYGR